MIDSLLLQDMVTIFKYQFGIDTSVDFLKNAYVQYMVANEGNNEYSYKTGKSILEQMLIDSKHETGANVVYRHSYPVNQFRKIYRTPHYLDIEGYRVYAEPKVIYFLINNAERNFAFPINLDKDTGTIMVYNVIDIFSDPEEYQYQIIKDSKKIFIYKD